MTPPRILIVEDEPDILELLVDEFTHQGYEVLAAERVAQAERIIRSEVLDAVLSDVRMPDGNGIDLMKLAVREGKGNICLVLVSAFTDISEQDARALGVKCIIQKPFRIRELIDTVKSALAA
jgi:two-component system OmpR family response regulator